MFKQRIFTTHGFKKLIGLLIALLSCGQVVALPDESIRDDVIYFMMTDRFSNGDQSNDYGDYSGSENDRDTPREILKHGFSPAEKAYYHGGDLQGVIDKLDYIKGLGANSIWLSPFQANKHVSGDGTIEGSSTSFHGYWIKDFLNVDAHLGSNEDLRNLIETAHASDVKIIQDIVVNHTADIIYYDECDPCPYRSKTDYPYLDQYGQPFDDVDYEYAFSTGITFPQMAASSFAFTPLTLAGEVKSPDWLNDMRYYSNRGESTFFNEDELYGDFHELDDLLTTHPDVIQGMADIYQYWMREFNIDGFRIDTIKNVNRSFWQQWVPEIEAYADSIGRSDFYMFGEVFAATPEEVSQYITESALPATLDYVFSNVVTNVFIKGQATDRLRQFFADDDYYTDADSNVYFLPTFLSNHDIGRVGSQISFQHPDESDRQWVIRSMLMHAMMFTVRGVPVIYYGDEQGFTGIESVPDQKGVVRPMFNDNISRQDMFPTQTAVYQDPDANNQIGTDVTPAADNFDQSHPLYRAIQYLANIRHEHRAFRRGAQLHRYSTTEPNGGIFSFTRIVKPENKEYLVVFNTHTSESQQATITTLHANTVFSPIHPVRTCDEDDISTDEFGQLNVTLPPMSFRIFQAQSALPERQAAPEVTILSPESQFAPSQFWIEAGLAEETFAEVSFYVRTPDNAEYQYLGTDDNAPYRLRFDGRSIALGQLIDLKVVVSDYSGNTTEVVKEAIRLSALPSVTVHYENGNNRPSYFGLDSAGSMIFPQPFVNGTLSFNWPLDVTDMTLFFEAPSLIANQFDFDKPIHLDLTRDIYSHAQLNGQGEMQAEIYINNAHQIAATNNFGNNTSLPETLPVEQNAESRLVMPIYVRGAFNEWEATNELEYVGNYTYFDRVVVDTPTNIYKFADEDWSFFNFGAPVAENGITLAASPPNLEIHFDKLGIYKSHFFTIPRAGNEDYYFHRFEYDPGPVGADIYLAVNDGADAQLIDYLGDSQYQIDAHLSAGENRIRFIDDAGASLLGARFSSEQWEQGSTLSLVESGMEIVVNVSTTALYRFNIAAVSGNYVLDIEPLVDHGPYGPLYLRGGVALTGQEDWLVADENLFVYEHDYQQLILRKSVDTRYTLASDWAFKVASQDWANQFAGSGEWLSNDNKVDIGQVFDLAQLIDGEGIEPEPLWVEPQLSSGMTIEFIIDVSEQSAPTLRVLLK